MPSEGELLLWILPSQLLLIGAFATDSLVSMHHGILGKLLMTKTFSGRKSPNYVLQPLSPGLLSATSMQLYHH
jgi:hypothetical protein